MSDPLLDSWRPFCGAELFPLPAAEPRILLREGDRIVVVHPPGGGPVHGPQPAVCMLGPHPRCRWHWDGNGTWWRLPS